jgi:hypothetical protein
LSKFSSRSAEPLGKHKQNDIMHILVERLHLFLNSVMLCALLSQSSWIHLNFYRIYYILWWVEYIWWWHYSEPYFITTIYIPTTYIYSQKLFSRRIAKLQKRAQIKAQLIYSYCRDSRQGWDSLLGFARCLLLCNGLLLASLTQTAHWVLPQYSSRWPSNQHWSICTVHIFIFVGEDDNFIIMLPTYADPDHLQPESGET